MSTKVSKLQYLGLFSSNFKYEDRSRNISIKKFRGEKPILIFWVLYLQNLLWLFIFLEGWNQARDPEQIFETWFFFFSPNSSILFQISIEVTFWLFNLENYALGLEQLFWAQVRKNSKSWRRIGFWKNLKCRIHTWPIFHSVLVFMCNFDWPNFHEFPISLRI